MGLDLLKTTRMHKPGVPGEKLLLNLFKSKDTIRKALILLINKTILHIAALLYILRS